MKRMICVILVTIMMVCVGGNLSAQGHYEGPDPINPSKMQVLGEDAENSSVETEMRGILQLPIDDEGKFFLRLVFPNLFNGTISN